MAWTTLVSPRELAQHLGDPDLVIVDCRFALADPTLGAQQYAAGHLPGARFADLDRDLSSPVTPTSGRHPLPDPAILAEQVAEWGVGRGSQVVAYDDAGGAFAARLWWLLGWLGHDRRAVLDGGYSAWIAVDLPVSTDLPQPQRGDFVANVNNDLWLTSDTLRARIDAGEVLVVDARDPERYRGEVEPIDPVAGHVPGAVNLPFKESLTADGHFLPVDQLAERFAASLTERSPGEVVHMCGSGVTACHNLLAMEAAGLHGSRLYAGSWSEWIRDPTRPVASGTSEL